MTEAVQWGGYDLDANCCSPGTSNGRCRGWVHRFLLGQLAASMVRQAVSKASSRLGRCPADGKRPGVGRGALVGSPPAGRRRQPADRAGALERRSDRPRGAQSPAEDPRPPHVLAASGQRVFELRRCLQRRPHRGRGRSAGVPRNHLPLRRRAAARRPGGNVGRVAAQAAGQHARRLAIEHLSPLRHRRRLLSPLARSGDGLHLRLLSLARRFAGGSAGGQDGTGLPQALAQAGRDGGRGGMRLGGVGALHGAALRRHGEGL